MSVIGALLVLVGLAFMLQGDLSSNAARSYGAASASYALALVFIALGLLLFFIGSVDYFFLTPRIE